MVKGWGKYLAALGELHGNGDNTTGKAANLTVVRRLPKSNPLVAGTMGSFSRRKISRTDGVPRRKDEEQDQIRVVTWLRKQNLCCHASPNGGRRTIGQTVKLKRMGMWPGWPDLEIPYARGKYHMLYVEMKREDGGKLSPAQVETHQFLREQGHAVAVAHGFDAAVKLISQYFSLGEFGTG